MLAETDLPTLLADLRPRLHGGAFCFVAAEDAAGLDAAASVREAEGWSWLVPVARAEAAGLPFDGRFRWITLEVHSALGAVGLTAAVATRLAAAGIAANVIAGRLHDHVLVPEARAEEAAALLEPAQPPGGQAIQSPSTASSGGAKAARLPPASSVGRTPPSSSPSAPRP
ncbi:ACT domain-containing protein [Phycisphaera mikurensis]|uniref:ACT domain-containing protein n=1 Tax=Phycisphaera mikurensis TaxID=547188 RepID=UPI0009464E57|nr:ACT domain-containing protein [Phycisphaera mikurensis]MBB6442207.1 hypothetical protein [Phycisphaera mikurensis]